MKKILNILCTAIAAVLLCGGIAGCAPQTYGTFYTLEEAYEAGILTHDELMSIAYYHNGGTRGNEAIMGEERMRKRLRTISKLSDTMAHTAIALQL